MATRKASYSGIFGDSYNYASIGLAISDVPDVPVISLATAGSLSGTVTFSSASTGGLATSYTVTSSPGGFTGTGSSSPITVSGLSSSSSYTFTMVAINSTGTSKVSNTSSSITPTAITPGAAFDLSVTTWTSRTSSVSFNQPRVFSRGSTFVALNFGTADASTYSSTDGITWTARTMPSSQRWSSFVYASAITLYVAISGALGSNSSAAATSTDGVTWTARTMSSSHAWNGVAGIGGSQNVVTIANDVGSGSNIAAYSADGVSWSNATMSSTRGWQGIAYGNSIFIAISNFTVVSTSSNYGLTWTERTFPFAAAGIAYGGTSNYFVVVGGTPGQTSAYSTDGTSWTTRTMPSNNYWYSVTSGNNGFVATSSINQVATSSDGITWTARTMPVSQNWFGSAWNGTNLWVALGDGTSQATAS